MTTQRILVIEDEAPIRRGIVDTLRFHGFDVFEAADGGDGKQMALRVECDLILLDIMLPGCSGLEILKAVRSSRPTLPVIILTARGDEDDRVQGLKLGADDYVVKPFSVRELMARVDAVLRRSPARPLDVQEVAVPGGTVDLARCEVRYGDGGRCELSEREVELFRYLAANPRRVITRDEILANVWRMNPTGVWTRTIDMHVVRLREKLRDDPARPQVIVTVRGRGYMFGAGDQ